MLGVMPTNVGEGFWTVNAPARVADPPPGLAFVTVTSREPVAAERAIEKKAVILVGLNATTESTEIPDPALTVVEPVTKSVPVKVTLTDRPLAPKDGVILRIPGAGFTTLKAPGRVAVPPPGPGFANVTVLGPRLAPALMAIWIVSVVPLPVTEETVIPSPNDTTVEPGMNPPPTTVTASDCNRTPLFGVMLTIEGNGFWGTTTSKPFVNVAVPWLVVTVTLRKPTGAPEPTEMFATISVDELNVTELTVMPELLNPTVLPPLTRFVPVSVTLSVVPNTAAEGETPLSVGGEPAV
jgi:hypothetical protein